MIGFVFFAILDPGNVYGQAVRISTIRDRLRQVLTASQQQGDRRGRHINGKGRTCVSIRNGFKD